MSENIKEIREETMKISGGKSILGREKSKHKGHKARKRSGEQRGNQKLKSKI